MGRKGVKISTEKKMEYARLVLSGKISASALAYETGISRKNIQYWVALFKAHGERAFVDNGTNKVYSPKLKLNAVLEYLEGKGSYITLSSKYGLRSYCQLHSWVKMYNNGEDFSNKMSGGSRMTTSRKTTKEERIQIVKECLENDRNYGEIAIKHNVSYQNVYSWVNRFKELGESGLEDRRGRRKVDQKPRSESEELKVRIAQLEHELYMTKMERDLLKKVEELERKNRYRK